MKIDTFRTLKKIMARTFTESDAEALTSIRAANRILAGEGLTWERVLDRTINVIAAVEEDPEAPQVSGSSSTASRSKHVDDEPTETLLLLAEEAAAHQGTGTQDFVASIRHQWEERKWLSPKQRQALQDVKAR